MTSRFSFVDLFAGIGGFHLALRGVGGECVAFSEIAHDAISAYCENLGIGPEANLGDITKLDELPPHDFLTGGVPCQSWSIAGRNLGFDDDRGSYGTTPSSCSTGPGPRLSSSRTSRAWPTLETGVHSTT